MSHHHPVPDRAHAARSHESPAYHAILPLRTENPMGTVLLIDSIDDDHRATDVLAPAAAAIERGRSACVTLIQT
jgi:hypothetical protein